MLSGWVVSAAPSSGFYDTCLMAFPRGVRGVMVVVEVVVVDGRSENCQLKIFILTVFPYVYSRNTSGEQPPARIAQKDLVRIPSAIV